MCDVLNSGGPKEYRSEEDGVRSVRKVLRILKNCELGKVYTLIRGLSEVFEGITSL